MGHDFFCRLKATENKTFMKKKKSEQLDDKTILLFDL